MITKKADCNHPCQDTLDQPHKTPGCSPCHPECHTGSGANTRPRVLSGERRSCTRDGSDTELGNQRPLGDGSHAGSHCHVCHRGFPARSHPHMASGPLRHHRHLRRKYVITIADNVFRISCYQDQGKGFHTYRSILGP